MLEFEAVEFALVLNSTAGAAEVACTGATAVVEADERCLVPEASRRRVEEPMLPARFGTVFVVLDRRGEGVLLCSCCCWRLRRLGPAEERKLVGIEVTGARSSHAIEVLLYATEHPGEKCSKGDGRCYAARRTLKKRCKYP